MEDTEQPSFSLSGSLRRIGNSLLSLLQNRIDLFALELQEEKQWLVATILWAGAAMFFCGLAIIFVGFTIVWLVPDTARPWVLAGLSTLFVILAATGVTGLRRLLREKPSAFSESVSELKKDIEWIRSQD
jgi:uncharacterized membrane protein YqjE